MLRSSGSECGRSRHGAPDYVPKIGTGLNGTVAGHVYLNSRCREEGNVTWAYCQGKLYLRKAGDKLGHVTIYDPADFRNCGELYLDLEEQFKDQR